MARPKIKTLFNKNHITITKTENPGSFIKNHDGIYSLYTRGRDPYYYRYKNMYEKVKVVKESPLGFYYTKEEQRLKPGIERDNKDVNDISGYEVIVGNTIYKISYVSASGDNKIKPTEDGLRPWQVVAGDGSMPEHLIMALKDVLDSIITVVEDNKLTFTNNNYGAEYFRKSLYRDFFGNEKGIRFQTDSEKILSHGFDLKTSFRR